MIASALVQDCSWMTTIRKLKFDYLLIGVVVAYAALAASSGQVERAVNSAMMEFFAVCLIKLFSRIETIGAVPSWFVKANFGFSPLFAVAVFIPSYAGYLFFEGIFSARMAAEATIGWSTWYFVVLSISSRVGEVFRR